MRQLFKNDTASQEGPVQGLHAISCLDSDTLESYKFWQCEL